MYDTGQCCLCHTYLLQILYGQSIGGAVSIDLASRNPLAVRTRCPWNPLPTHAILTKISAMILENTFLSLPRLVPSALPVLGPFAFLCHQKWDSASKVPRIPKSIPFLMLSGSQDEVVPKEHMEGLWEIVKKREDKSIMGTEATSPGSMKIPVAAVDPRGVSKYVVFEKGTHST